MVLNNQKPYDSDSSAGEDPWEMVGEYENEPEAEATTPLVTPAQIIPTAVPDHGDAGDQAGRNDEHEPQLLEPEVLNAENNNDGHDGNASFISGVSSITGDHHSVSDVDEEESLTEDIQEHEDVEEVTDNPDSSERTQAAVPSTSPESAKEEAVGINAIEHSGCPLGTYATFDQNEFKTIFGSSADMTDRRNWFTVHQMNVDGDITWTGLVVTGPHSPEGMSWMRRDPIVHGAFNDGDVLIPATDPLVEQLSQMGFEKEQINKAMGDLRREGVTDIDADSVIGSMAGESNVGSTPFSNTWDFVESTVQDIDRRHQLRHRTQSCMQNINRSVQDIWSNVRNESLQFRSNLSEACDQADDHARNAATSARFAASSVKDSACRANEKHRITEKLATVAVVGGATLLALGNPRAGVGAIAVAGATLAAGEAMKQSSAQSTAQSRDYGLNEDLHLD